MSTQKYPKTILEAVYLAGKSMLEWIGTAGGLATLDTNSRLAQIPYSNPVEGYLNLALLATANNMIAIANALPEGTFRFYLVGDNSGGSSAGTIIMNTTVALLFGSASLGANTGDLIMISNIAGTKSYKLIPLGNANAPSGGFPGNSGVFSVADKVTLDKLFPVTRKAVITVIGINRVYDSSGNQENNTYEDLSPVLGDLIVGITDTSISATAFNPAILRWDGQSFKVILSGTDCTNKCILWFSPEDGLPIPYYLDDYSLWPTVLASEKSIGSYFLGDNAVNIDKLTTAIQKSIKSVKNSTLVCTGVGYGYSSTDYSGNVYGGTPSEGDLIVGNIDHGVSHTEYAPAILRYNGEVFEVLFYGAECVGRFVFVNDSETGCMLPYYIGGEEIVNMAPLWPFSITNMLLATASVTGDKIADNTIVMSNFNDNLFDALNPWYLNQINGPVYLKIGALQMSTPTNAAWGKYATTVAAWDALKNAVINGIPVYIVDAFPLVANTGKYLCTVMYNSIHGNENNGSFLLQYNPYSTNVAGFRFTRVSATAFTCESF